MSKIKQSPIPVQQRLESIEKTARSIIDQEYEDRSYEVLESYYTGDGKLFSQTQFVAFDHDGDGNTDSFASAHQTLRDGGKITHRIAEKNEDGILRTVSSHNHSSDEDDVIYQKKVDLTSHTMTVQKHYQDHGKDFLKEKSQKNKSQSETMDKRMDNDLYRYQQETVHSLLEQKIQDFDTVTIPGTNISPTLQQAKTSIEGKDYELYDTNEDGNIDVIIEKSASKDSQGKVYQTRKTTYVDDDGDQKIDRIRSEKRDHYN